MTRLLALAALVALLALPARAEDLIVTLSDRTVDITSNFTGSAITVFGAVRRDASTVPRASDYDVVVTVTGPPVDAVTRQKARVAGIWINRHQRVFEDVPSAYTVLSNRPVEDIAHPALLGRLAIGIDYLLPSEAAQEAGAAAPAEALPGRPQDRTFARAFLRLQRQARVYQEDPGAVEVIDNSLFRARAAFPADVPLGTFTVRVFLFSGGVMLAQEEVDILVRKAGFEQILFAASQERPVLYGLGAVVLALVTGWLGGVVFRRA